MLHDAHVLAYRLEALRLYLGAICSALGVPVSYANALVEDVHTTLGKTLPGSE